MPDPGDPASVPLRSRPALSDAELEGLLAGCAEEPIHAPGAIQPHGALLGVDAFGSVVVASANCAEIVGFAPAFLLGRALADTFGRSSSRAMLDADAGEVAIVDLPDGRCEVVARAAGPLTLVELEREPVERMATESRLHHALRVFHGATDVDDLVDQAARAVRELTGFDRVMIYRFDDDWNGEVVAEQVAPGHASFLGLRYPASDIPAQARALYSRTRLRLIPDARAEPSPLLAVDPAAAAALDLSDVALRAVSPVHLVYLQHMGVDASMSVAIHAAGRLWGLIACHHLTGPLRPSLRERDAVDLVGRTTSTVLGALLVAEASADQVDLLSQLDLITVPLWSDGLRDVDDALAVAGMALPELLSATSAAVVSGANVRPVGAAPPPELISALVERTRASGERLLVVRELGALDPAWREHAAVAAGAVVLQTGANGDHWTVWFRPETRELVRWGGDPSAKEVVADDDGRLRLDPRSSFAEYLEQVEGRSTRWTDQEVEVARTLGRRIAELHAARTLQKAELAATMQRTLLLEGFPAISGIKGAARYVPSESQPIGGDWYDVLFRPHGGPVLAIGDVAGHGVDAASTMAQLRHALRAYVVREETPAEAMHRLNQLMLTLLPGEMASAMLVALDPGGETVEVVNAGHLPPVIIDADGARRLPSAKGPVLGALPNGVYEPMTVALPPGATLLIYSDGLIERRNHSLDDNIAMLVNAAARARHLPIAELCDRLLAEGATHSDTADDVTLVAVRMGSEG